MYSTCNFRDILKRTKYSNILILKHTNTQHIRYDY